MNDLVRCSDCGNAVGAEISIRLKLCTDCNKNDRGGERAKCPECGMPHDKMFYFDKQDTRHLECIHCHKFTYNGAYYPAEFQKSKEEYEKTKGVNE